MHFALRYIGQPYEAVFFDCWQLVRTVYRERFKIELPNIQIDPKNLRQLIQTIRDHPVRLDWQPTANPREGDVALLRQSRHPVHVGVWLDVDGGGVLHCLRGCGVVFQTLASLRLSGWQIESFYTYIGDLNHDRNGHPSPQPVSAGTQP